MHVLLTTAFSIIVTWLSGFFKILIDVLFFSQGDLNMTMLQSEDFMNASVAQATKSPAPVFAKL